MKYKKSELVIAGLTLTYVVSFFIAFIFQKNIEFLAYAIILIIVGIIVWKTLPESKLDSFALAGLSIWGFMHLAGGGIILGGEAGVLYGLKLVALFDGGGQFYILKYDQLVHFIGFGVTAIVMFQLFTKRFNNKVGKKFVYFVTIVSALGLSALNEVIEFATFIALPNTFVGDFYNVGLDLVFNTLGAIAGTIISTLRKS